MIKTVPEDTSESDVDEVEEVDQAKDKDPNRLVREELSYSDDEMRSRHNYALSLAIGHTLPWETYSVTAAYLVRPDFAIGAYAGGGGFHPNGIQNQKSYNMSIESRGGGLLGRYWFERLEKLSVAGAVGYSTWSGTLAPEGSDPSTNPADQLDAAFHANGLTAGFSASLTWIWDSGLFLQWTPVGIEASHVVAVDYTRDSDIVHGAVMSNIQRTGFFGLIDMEFGYFF